VDVAVGSHDDQTVAADFDAIIGPWIEPGYRLAVAMLRDPDEAHDAVQEAAVKAWRSLDRLREGAPARPWFFAIVANQCRSTMRRRWWSVLRLSGHESFTADTEAAVAQSVDLDRAMAALSPDDRAILHLHYYLDLPLDEVGRVLGISFGAAKSRVYRAVHRLRPDLELMEEDFQ
jgi:RNA polymerase sigma-70 factor (ECF subfamily)